MLASTSSDDSENSLDTIQQTWHEVPLNMKTFSRSMLRLAYELNISTTSNERALVEFKQLRDDTRRDSQIYCRQILPVAQQVIQNMSDYFDNYDVLTYDEWKEDLTSIHEEVIEYKYHCDILIQLHEKLMAGLKARLAKAKVSFKDMEELNEKYKKQMEELQSDARRLHNEGRNSRTHGMIWGIFTLGIGNVIGDAIADNKEYQARQKTIDATAKEAQMKIIAGASELCCNVLIPALGAFIEGLEAVSSFFATTEQNLGKIADNTVGERNSRRYFKKTQKVGKEINQGCRAFAGVLPAIRSDLAAIPENSSDANYVDNWRRDTMKEVRERYERKMRESGSMMILNKVMKSIAHIHIAEQHQ